MLQAQDLGAALATALKGEQPGTHHMPSMYKPVVRFTDDACQVRGKCLPCCLARLCTPLC